MKSSGWIFTGKSEKKQSAPPERAPNLLFTAKGGGASRNGGGKPPKSSPSSRPNNLMGAGQAYGWNTNAPEFIPSAPPATIAYPAQHPPEWSKGGWASQVSAKQGWRKWTDGVPSEHEQFDMWEKEWNTAKTKDGKILVVLVDGKPSEDVATLAAAAAASSSSNGAKPKPTSAPYEANGARKAKGKATKSTKMGWKPKADGPEAEAEGKPKGGWKPKAQPEKAAPAENAPDKAAAGEKEAPAKSAEAASS
jgi:hypothetical protein